MMEAGGAKKRVELLKMVDETQITNGMKAMGLGAGSGATAYTQEERKVAMHGDKGQGEYLTDAKRRR